jgi:hypothetical protein
MHTQISINFLKMPNFLILPVVFECIVYWMANLNPDFTRFLICCTVIVLVVQCSLAFGTFLSVVSPSTNVGKHNIKGIFAVDFYNARNHNHVCKLALSLAGPVLVPLMIFSGFLLNYDSIPSYFIWLRYLSWFGYANELLVVNQWSGVENISCPSNATTIGMNGPMFCFTKGEQIINYLKVKPVRVSHYYAKEFLVDKF